MRRLLLVLTALMGAAFATTTTLGFGTVLGVLGQNAEHERITRNALDCAIATTVADCFEPLSIDELAGKKGTFGAVGAPDNPRRGLMSIDEAHCDNGDYFDVPGYPHPAGDALTAIQNCRIWMTSHLDDAVTFAGAMLDINGNPDPTQTALVPACKFDGKSGLAKCNVLEQLGLTLHASEDFYSHSNWADQAAPGAISITNPPGIGSTKIAPWLNLRTMSADFPLLPRLITGCYKSWPERFHCGGRVKHEYLNKDTGNIAPPTFAPGSAMRGKVAFNFRNAVVLAIEDTIDKWATLKERLIARYGAPKGTVLICALTHDDPARRCIPLQQQQQLQQRSGDTVLMSTALSMAALMAAGVAWLGRRPRGKLRPS